jgi:glycosyltransferase involved in cell wall biosynthesis
MKILITIPCYNEEKRLERNIIRLNDFLKKNLKEPYLIDIADNNSKDNTREIAKKLEKKYSTVKYTFVKEQGKGLAIKYSWNNTGKNYDILSFMDADLATDISAFPKMIQKITKENFDLVYGSRYHPESNTKRTIVRKIISKGYLLLQKWILGVSFSDSQCGFKAIKKFAYLKIKDLFLKKRLSGDKNDMFFDTELLTLAKYNGFKMTDYPVTWKEQKETSVKIFKYSLLFFRYLFYFRKNLRKQRN